MATQNDSLKELLKQAAVEFAKVEADYLTAKAKFDNLFNRIMESRNGGSAVAFGQLPLRGDVSGKRSLTEMVLAVLPKDFRPLHIKQITALVGGKPIRNVSATCFNLRKQGKIERAGPGTWKLKEPEKMKEAVT